jgi:hypothetical protein
MGQLRNAYKILVKKSAGKRTHGREDNNRRDFKEV